MVGIQKDDVVHMLTDGDDLDSVTSVVAVWAVGAIPAFGEATLVEEAIIDQVCLGWDSFQYLRNTFGQYQPLLLTCMIQLHGNY